MTPQKKANELVEKFQNIGLGYVDSIECAIIAVNEVLSVAQNNVVHLDHNGLTDTEFWQEVKQELNEML